VRVWGRSDLDKCPKVNKSDNGLFFPRPTATGSIGFGQVSETDKDRLLVCAGVGEWLDLDKCPKSTNRLLADAVGIAPMTVNDRIKSYTDLDKCPKPYKIASSRVRVWGMLQFRQVSKKQQDRPSRVRVWGTKVDFCRILQKCLLEECGCGCKRFVRILTKQSIASSPRVGAGYQSGLLENSPKVPPRRVRRSLVISDTCLNLLNRLLARVGVGEQMLLENSPKAFYPGLPVRCRPGAGCGKRLFPAKVPV